MKIFKARDFIFGLQKRLPKFRILSQLIKMIQNLPQTYELGLEQENCFLHFVVVASLSFRRNDLELFQIINNLALLPTQLRNLIFN